jgi:hypothetical protein
MPKYFTLEFFQKTGKQGSKATSKAKAEAARKNGKLRGRRARTRH